jgi:hypothetical protein
MNNDKKVLNENVFNNFEKYVRRQSIARFLVRYELFRLIATQKGCIVECGVHHGGGLMAWAKLSSALEPYAIHRRVFGFDTFEGFPAVSAADTGANAQKGGFQTDYDVYTELLDRIHEYDENRYLSSFPKVELVKGDATSTIPDFLEQNKDVIVSLLFLDFDLYEPTKAAIEGFLPRMPRGAVIAFDEVNNHWWPGETQAMLEMLSINELRLKKFSFDPNIAYAIIGD